jgi:hypothetical protein
LKSGAVLALSVTCALVLCVFVSGAEAKSKYTLSVKFTDYCCGYGKQGQKVTVTLTNLATDEKLGKKTFKFKDVIKHGSKASLDFSRKDSRTGDQIDIIAEGTGPSGGRAGTDPLNFDVNKHKYTSVIELDEFGCDLPGFSCE